MFRNNRFFVSLFLVFALLAQPLVAMAQNKTLNSGGANSSAGQNGASVDLTRVRPVGPDVVDVTWDVVIPSGVEVLGFDVRVDAGLSNGTTQTDSQSFGGNARSGSFKFNLPLASNGGSPKPGGGTGGIIGPANNGGGGIGANQAICQNGCAKSTKTSSDFQKCVASCQNGGSNGGGSNGIKEKSAQESDKTPRKFGQGNISGGGTVSPKPTPTPKLNPSSSNPAPLPRPTPPAKPAQEQVRITKLQAFITARFATGNDLAAFSEFIQPTDKITGEMRLKGARGNSLQVKKLIHLNEVARLATDCPAGQECFDVLAELRGVNPNGQFKVSLEAIYSNGQRRTNSRTAGNLFRPVRLSVDKVAGATVANVLVNINGGGNREQFTKTDTQGVAVLAPTLPSKKE
jgi:hypothetical protein